MTEFFINLKYLLEEENLQNINFKKLNNQIMAENNTIKEKNIIKSSLVSFWDNYVCNSRPTSFEVINAIERCLSDLKFDIYQNKELWFGKIHLVPKRKNSYENLNKKLKDFGVHYPDNNIVLDAHNFNIMHMDYSLDFITFDEAFYKTIVNIDEFFFNKIIGKYDLF